MFEGEYIPLNLWIREDQMNKITEEAYEKSTTIYTLIRNIIDFYYKEDSYEKANSSDEFDHDTSVY